LSDGRIALILSHPQESGPGFETGQQSEISQENQTCRGLAAAFLPGEN
jgi:hypothetical protein